MPIGGGDRIAGLPLDILVTPLVAVLSVFFAGDSPGKGDCSFCSCCFFWILRCSCCLASTGDGRVFTCGWKELLSAVGIKAEGWGIPFIPECKRRTNYNHTYPVCCSDASVSNHTEFTVGVSTAILGLPPPWCPPIHFMLKSIQCFNLCAYLWQKLSVRQAAISCYNTMYWHLVSSSLKLQLLCQQNPKTDAFHLTDSRGQCMF